MKVHKDKIIFREKFLNTEEGKTKQTENENWKKLKEDIKNNGIINPLICIEKDGKYRLCIGMRRFIAGLMLGIEEYKVELVSDEEVKTLRNAKAKYQTKHKNGKDIAL